jgi:hypothetical protein
MLKFEPLCLSTQTVISLSLKLKRGSNALLPGRVGLVARALLTDIFGRPSGNYKIETANLTMQPKTVYVTLRKRIKEKKLTPLSLSFRSGALYIIKSK